MRVCVVRGAMCNLNLNLVPLILNDKHREELRFQRSRRRIRKIEFLKNGMLLKHEVTPQLHRDAREYHKRERTNLMNTLQRAKRRRVAGAHPDIDPTRLQGATVYHAADISKDACAKWTTKHNMVNVSDRKAATVFIVKRLTQPGRRVLWAAGLAGGMVITPKLNVFLVYHKMLRKRAKRCFFWMSDEFVASAPATASIIRHLVEAAHGWRLVTRDEFAAHADAAMSTKAKYRGHLFGLIKRGEMHGLGTSCKPRIFHERRLLKLCACVDAEHSRLGSG